MLRSKKSKLLFLSLLLLTAFLTASTISAQCARPGLKLASGNFSNRVWTIIARDFNGDNKMDIASVYDTGFIVSLGDGLGGFSSQTLYPVDLYWLKIYSGDINGDGKLDIILSGPNQWGYAIWLNNGAGAFSYLARVNYVTSFYEANLEVIDFNGDGKSDFLDRYTISGTPVLQLRFGDGAGNFAAPVNYSVNNLQSYVPGDFNGDGKKDLAVLTNNAPPHALTIYLNNGTGTLTPGTPINLATRTQLREARDFNGDGKDDILALSEFNLVTVSILLNNGSGGFTKTDYPLYQVLSDVRAADFNGDGKLDVMTSHYSTPDPTINASVLLGDGLGGFTRRDYKSGVPLGWTTYGDVADFNGDNMADIVQLAENIGPQPQKGFRIWQATCNQNSNTKRIDYTGDGFSDFALWRPSNGMWTIKINNNSFRTVQWGLGSLGDVPVPGDYDGDGKSDIAVFRKPTGGWYVLRSSDDSGFGIQWGADGDKPAPGDYDADGKTDFAVFRPSDGGWYILKSSDNTMASYAFGTNGDKPVQADYDNDDKTDVAVYRPSSGDWYILKSSDNSFVAMNFGISADKPVPADYDGDGKADIAVYRSGEGFYIRRSWNNSLQTLSIYTYYGTPAPQDQPALFSSVYLTTPALWRPGAGSFVFYVLASFNEEIAGTAGDIPVTTPYFIE